MVTKLKLEAFTNDMLTELKLDVWTDNTVPPVPHTQEDYMNAGIDKFKYS